MNKQYKLRNSAELFFVAGLGFVGTQANATVVDDAKATCLTGLGFSYTKVEVPASYAVVYIRRGEGAKLLAGQGKDKTDANKGQVDPSKRRFATRDEAHQHGSRFPERRANAGDQPGSAGHEGFFVVETYDAVNSVINWKSGKTNSLKS